MKSIGTQEDKKTVLIVEDNVMTGEILQTVLEAAGARAMLCRDGASALTLVEQQRYNVLITDFRIFDTAGSEIVRHARMTSPETFIIGVSVDQMRERDFIDAGADAFLLKPFELTKLLTLVAQGHPCNDVS